MRTRREALAEAWIDIAHPDAPGRFAVRSRTGERCAADGVRPPRARCSTARSGRLIATEGPLNRQEPEAIGITRTTGYGLEYQQTGSGFYPSRRVTQSEIPRVGLGVPR